MDTSGAIDTKKIPANGGESGIPGSCALKAVELLGGRTHLDELGRCCRVGNCVVRGSTVARRK
jgi:hypothetical protein